MTGGRNLQEILDGHSLEVGRLLEGESDSETGALRDILICYILFIEYNLAVGRLLEPHNKLGKGRLAATVWAGNDDKFAWLNI